MNNEYSYLNIENFTFKDCINWERLLTLCCWWLILPIQNNEKQQLKND